MGADDRKLLNGPLFLASQVILAILSTPAFVPRPVQTIAFVVLGWYFYEVVFTQTTGDFNSDFGLGSAIIVQYILALDYALTPPENLKDFHDKNPTKVTERSLKNRVLWQLKLFSNPRGIGRAHEVPHLSPPSPSTPRSRFVVSRILFAACSFLVVGGVFVFDVANTGTTTADKLLTGAPLHQRVLGVMSFGLGGIFVISGVNAVLSAVIVGCGLSSPARWPQLFGSPLQLWSIGRFWGRFWHQLFRRFLLSSTSSILGIVFPQKYVGSTGYKLARLYLAFFISGLAHAGGDVMATGKVGFKSFTFFMLQPFGITIELIASYLWRYFQCGNPNPRKLTNEGAKSEKHRISNDNNEDLIPPAWVRCVGSIWLALWMVWTAAYMVDARYSARLSAASGRI